MSHRTALKLWTPNAVVQDLGGREPLDVTREIKKSEKRCFCYTKLDFPVILVFVNYTFTSYRLKSASIYTDEIYNTSWSHVGPPQLASFNMKEQHLFSELTSDVWAPHPVSKAEPSHPAEETHFGCLYPWCQSLRHNPKLVTVDRLVNQKLCPCYCWHRSMLPSVWTKPRDNWTPSLEGAIHRFPAESHELRLGGSRVYLNITKEKQSAFG